MSESQQRTPNRLADETSPYLQQHAFNPVDWYPWGEEAIEKARAEDKPIFLSVGYSACHWCHVMEHESFENDTIAGLMNDGFINVKVDREERPDVDQIYMNAVLALSGHGGWPMSVFLTPELKPFYGGTYWPPASRMGMPGFADILNKVSEAWGSRRDELQNSADELTQAVIRMGGPQGEKATPGEQLLLNAQTALEQSSDKHHGGFGGAPKFPHPMSVRLMLRLAQRTGESFTREVALMTLDKMARGGIYDHLGGGFHRYATDAAWLVPHFEKMLYDNALLTPAYVEAFQITGEERYATVVRETLDYTLREMTDDAGAFYSTQDADSEGEEGKFFVWNESEIDEHLAADDAKIFKACYDVRPRGNWEGKTILNRPHPQDEAAEAQGMQPQELEALLARCRQTLFDVRKERIAPGRDEKMLTSWNGMMISAMAIAGSVLDEERYINAARNAADFVLANLLEDSGRLLHSYKDGRARFNGYLDDYACLIDGLIDLYQAVFDAKYLEAAVQLAETMIARFQDADAGGFFYTSDDHEQLIARNKDSQDNATPSGNAMAATALLKLARLTGRGEFEQQAVVTLELLTGQLARYPQSGGQALMAVDFFLGPAYEIVIVPGDDAAENDAVLHAVREVFLPNKVVAMQSTNADSPAVLASLLADKPVRDGRATVYFCEKGACQEPAVGLDAIHSAVNSLRRP